MESKEQDPPLRTVSEQERIRVWFQPLIEWAMELECEDYPVFCWDRCRAERDRRDYGQRLAIAREELAYGADPDSAITADEALAPLYETEPR